jgi:hypothetical protein
MIKAIYWDETADLTCGEENSVQWRDANKELNKCSYNFGYMNVVTVIYLFCIFVYKIFEVYILLEIINIIFTMVNINVLFLIK